MDHCGFDILFSKNVPHILKKIFFYLDYESFNNCLEVNKTWNGLLTSEQYQKKAKSTFGHAISKDLWVATLFGNANEVMRLLTFVLADVDCAHEATNSTPLFEDALDGYKEVVQVLLDRGAEPNKEVKFSLRGFTDQDGETPLDIAALSGHKDVVKLLQDGGAQARNY